MKKLISELKKLQKSDIKKKVDKRLSEFRAFQNKSNKEWFSELCFCLLTANSKAATAINIQKELAAEGFCSACADDVKNCIIRNKHRFHNNKTKFIIEAREYLDIKSKIKKIVPDAISIAGTNAAESKAREWLVKNIKGLGYKEASHFLRNVGYFNLAILDRHIINLLIANDYLKEKPKYLTGKYYLEIEKMLGKIAAGLKMSQAELDLYMWYMKTGKILK